jgi:pimeloyl-ACP methyl ester carboxylesterase
MAIETDVDLANGRRLHVYDSGVGDLPVFWLHGSPQTGALLEPLLAAAPEHGIRWLSYDRPGYGGSTRHHGRDFAAAVPDIAAIADALGVDRFAVLGHSGGGPHALACGALLPERVSAVVSGASPAPFDAEGLDWFAGFADQKELHAAAEGQAALEAYLATAEFDEQSFTPADHAMLAGEWHSLGVTAGIAMAGDTGGYVDDSLALVAKWGLDPASVAAPLLLVHGDEDRMVPFSHGEWLARHCPGAEWWPSPGDGHISVLRHWSATLDWLGEQARQER